MSDVTPAEPPTTQKTPEVAKPKKAPRTPEEEAAHLLKKAAKEEREVREA